VQRVAQCFALEGRPPRLDTPDIKLKEVRKQRGNKIAQDENVPPAKMARRVPRRPYVFIFFCGGGGRKAADTPQNYNSHPSGNKYLMFLRAHALHGMEWTGRVKKPSDLAHTKRTLQGVYVSIMFETVSWGRGNREHSQNHHFSK